VAAPAPAAASPSSGWSVTAVSPPAAPAAPSGLAHFPPHYQKAPKADLRTLPPRLPPVERLSNGRGFIEYGLFYPLTQYPTEYVQVMGRINNCVAVFNPPDTSTTYFVPIRALKFRSPGFHFWTLPAPSLAYVIVHVGVSRRQQHYLNQPANLPQQGRPRPPPHHPKPPRKRPRQRVKGVAAAPPVPVSITMPPSSVPPSSVPPIVPPAKPFRPPKHRLLSDAGGWLHPPLQKSPQTIWEVLLGTAASPQWQRFDDMLSQAIEQAYLDGVDSVGYFLNSFAYVLTFATLEQENQSTRMKRTVRKVSIGTTAGAASAAASAAVPQPPSLVDASRVALLLKGLEPVYPSYWQAADVHEAQQHALRYKLVPCVAGEAEFDLVSKFVMQTSQGERILRIQKIVNPWQYFKYMTWCDALQARRAALNLNQQYVFHGTAESALSSILSDGFKYRYNRRHMYGRGNYFATQAKYSLDPIFAVPNAKNEKFLLVARICLGQVVPGLEDMAPSVDDSYHTSTDNVHHPTIYVTFHDDQAFPEFLVTLQ